MREFSSTSGELSHAYCSLLSVAWHMRISLDLVPMAVSNPLARSCHVHALTSAIPHYAPQRGKDRIIDPDTTYVMCVSIRMSDELELIL